MTHLDRCRKAHRLPRPMSLSREVHCRDKAPKHGDPWTVSIGGMGIRAFIQKLRDEAPHAD